MKFIKLTIENYNSFQFATEIPFPVADDGRSIFLIGGLNVQEKLGFYACNPIASILYTPQSAWLNTLTSPALI